MKKSTAWVVFRPDDRHTGARPLRRRCGHGGGATHRAGQESRLQRVVFRHDRPHRRGGDSAGVRASRPHLGRSAHGAQRRGCPRITATLSKPLLARLEDSPTSPPQSRGEVKKGRPFGGGGRKRGGGVGNEHWWREAAALPSEDSGSWLTSTGGVKRAPLRRLRVPANDGWNAPITTRPAVVTRR